MIYKYQSSAHRDERIKVKEACQIFKKEKNLSYFVIVCEYELDLDEYSLLMD